MNVRSSKSIIKVMRKSNWLNMISNINVMTLNILSLKFFCVPWIHYKPEVIVIFFSNMYQFNVMHLYLQQVFDNCLFNVTHSRVGHSFMYLVIYLRRKGIYHEAIYLRNWNLYTPISTDKSNFFHFRWPYLYV